MRDARRWRRFAACGTALLCMAAPGAQDASRIVRHDGGSYTLVERTDLRRYDNGKYAGLLSREVRSFIAQAERLERSGGSGNSESVYDGNFYVVEAVKRASHEVGAGIREAIPAVFTIDGDGRLAMVEDNGYPSFRSFPAFPEAKVRPGDSWQAKAERAVDPLNKGIVTRMPMLVAYTYLRDDTFRGEDVYVFSAEWATRYGKLYVDPNGDAGLKEAQGSHKATMYVSRRTGSALVVRDAVDEYFVYADGTRIAFKGTISLFTEYPPAVDRGRIIPALQRVAGISEAEAKALAVAPSGGSGTGGASGGTASGTDSAVGRKPRPQQVPSDGGSIVVENTPAGIRLTIQNVQFKADSAELLPGEDGRLDGIASVLKEAPQSQFLVEGHTADTGNPRGEQRLSEERARAVAEALSARGIPAERFICKGSGSRKPVADNASPEGRARNRRVEITILE